VFGFCLLRSNFGNDAQVGGASAGWQGQTTSAIPHGPVAAKTLDLDDSNSDADGGTNDKVAKAAAHSLAAFPNSNDLLYIEAAFVKTTCAKLWTLSDLIDTHG
jgi:hypothetical protein